MKNLLITILIIISILVGFGIAHAQRATPQQIQLLQYTIDSAVNQMTTDNYDIGLDKADIVSKQADYDQQNAAASAANAYIQEWEASQTVDNSTNATDNSVNAS